MKVIILSLLFLCLISLPSFSQGYRYAHVFYDKKTREKVISITVDGCNNPSIVEKMLKIAEIYSVKMTFFPTGKNVLNQKDLWRKVYALGHQIELHTFSHRKMNCSREIQAEEIISNISAIRTVLGKEIVFSFLRLPYGIGLEKNNLPRLAYALREAVKLNGGPLDIAMWETDLLFIDGKVSNSAQVLSYFKSNLRPGNTSLFHARKEEVVYFEDMVAEASRSGYKMETLDQLSYQEKEYLAKGNVDEKSNKKFAFSSQKLNWN